VVHEQGSPKIRELDFSEFHPLDHCPAMSRCRSLPGGTRRHIALAMEFKWPSQLAQLTRCRVAWHRYTEGWCHDKPCVICRDCWAVKHTEG
jgi:hypothetical protein